MRHAVATILACLLLAAPQARAEPPKAGIRAVIEDQIAAFRAGALDRAFAHASPDIRAKFGDAETFGRMVRSGYPMIWRPAGWEWAGLAREGGAWMQTVVIRDGSGRFHEADYRMEMVDGDWRIDGVWLRPMPAAGS